jgi:hypothetical protein
MKRSEVLVHGLLSALLVATTIHSIGPVPRGDATKYPLWEHEYAVLVNRPTLAELNRTLGKPGQNVMQSTSEPFYIWFDTLRSGDGLGVVLEGEFGADGRLAYFTRVQHFPLPLRWDMGIFRTGRWEYSDSDNPRK